ncbi:MAG TPA: class I SAM-dependent methyltransferase [Alphaproteobacteria bacterium]|nr:class I SAM-dependent methyltransferase [Alphaproteobacteria bacterium]
MGLYERHMLPLMTDWVMGQKMLRDYRLRVVGGARGRVLELGVGSGRNLPFYTKAVDEVIGVDPTSEMLAMAERAAAALPRKITLLERSAEEVPLDDSSIDTVVVTFSLCTIPDPHAAVAEARRVLKPTGELRFVEHGWSPDARVRKWQDRLTPLWTRCAGGCHLNRKMDDIVNGAGFEIADLRTGYAAALKPMAYLYEGSAHIR